MSNVFNITDKERERVGQRIENALEFVRDILNDPSILDHIPSGSHVESIPIAERDPDRHYDIVTPRMVAIVTPGGMADMEPTPRPNGRTRRIHRDDASRLRRIRAAYR